MHRYAGGASVAWLTLLGMQTKLVPACRALAALGQHLRMFGFHQRERESPIHGSREAVVVVGGLAQLADIRAPNAGVASQ